MQDVSGGVMPRTTVDGRFLNSLTHGRARIDASAIALIVAHPDDESISCGGQLARMDGLWMVLVTDGAPRNLLDARACGFATATEYARARAAEFQAAMQLVHVQRIVRLEISDQEAARQTRERMLQELSQRPVLVIGTHFAGATAGRIIRDGCTYRLV